MFINNKIFQKNEKVRLKHTLVNCKIYDKMDCLNPTYWILLDGKVYKKNSNDLSYNVGKTIKINFLDICNFIEKLYYDFFGTNEKDVKYSYLKIFLGICIGFLLKSLIIKN